MQSQSRPDRKKNTKYSTAQTHRSRHPPHERSGKAQKKIKERGLTPLHDTGPRRITRTREPERASTPRERERHTTREARQTDHVRKSQRWNGGRSAETAKEIPGRVTATLARKTP